MDIGIIGAGNIGGVLARRLTEVGHRVSIANSRGPGTLRELAEATGAAAVTAAEAVRGRDLVVVTVPQRAVPALASAVFAGDALDRDTVLVDTGNYYPQRDGRIDDIEAGVTESRWVAQQLGRPVVKAFNTIYFVHLLERGRPPGTPGRIALPIAGDDAAAKSLLAGLIDELGFDAVDAGGLDDSWRQQPGTPVYAADLDADGVREALAQARPERPPEFRAAGD